MTLIQNSRTLHFLLPASDFGVSFSGSDTGSWADSAFSDSGSGVGSAFFNSGSGDSGSGVGSAFSDSAHEPLPPHLRSSHSEGSVSEVDG